MNTYTLMRTCVANTGVRNWNVSVIPESSVVPLFQAVVTHRGPAGLLPIAVDLSTSCRISSKWDHGTLSVSVWYLALAAFAFHEAMLLPVSTDPPFLFLRATLWYEYTAMCPSVLLTDAWIVSRLRLL